MYLSKPFRLLGFLWLVGVSAGACTFYLEGQDLPRTEGASPRPAKALLVGSVTNPDPHLGTHADIKFFFRQVNGDRNFHVSNAPHTGWLNGPERKTDPGLENVAGKLFSVSIVPGEYELVRATIWLQFSKDVEFDPGPRFQIGPGEIAYIGSLEVTNCYSLYIAPNGERRRQTVVGGFIDVRDASDRDLPALRTVFPSLQQAAIIKRVIDSDALAAGGAEDLSQSCTYEHEKSN